MLETRISDSYVTPGFGNWVPGNVTTVYDPMSHDKIRDLDLPGSSPFFPDNFMYMGSNKLGDFRQLNDNTLIVPYGNLTGIGGDVHDTFNHSPSGNIYNGHTTIRTLGGLDSHHDW